MKALFVLVLGFVSVSAFAVDYACDAELFQNGEAKVKPLEKGMGMLFLADMGRYQFAASEIDGVLDLAVYDREDFSRSFSASVFIPKPHLDSYVSANLPNNGRVSITCRHVQ